MTGHGLQSKGFQNHTQPIPCEQYDEVCGQSQAVPKFASLSYQWDVDKIDQRDMDGWLRWKTNNYC